MELLFATQAPAHDALRNKTLTTARTLDEAGVFVGNSPFWGMWRPITGSDGGGMNNPILASSVTAASLLLGASASAEVITLDCDRPYDPEGDKNFQQDGVDVNHSWRA